MAPYSVFGGSMKQTDLRASPWQRPIRTDIARIALQKIRAILQLNLSSVKCPAENELGMFLRFKMRLKSPWAEVTNNFYGLLGIVRNLSNWIIVNNFEKYYDQVALEKVPKYYLGLLLPTYANHRFTIILFLQGTFSAL